MNKLVLISTLAAFNLSAQTDTTANLPLYEITNSGIRMIQYFQEEFHFVVISETDSQVLDDHCNSEKVNCDTIWVAKSELYNVLQVEDYMISNVCNYSGDEKHGKEYEYYSVHELDGILITGWNYRLKSAGKWKHGKKDGKWYYYSRSGELVRTEKWKNGRLIRTQNAD